MLGRVKRWLLAMLAMLTAPGSDIVSSALTRLALLRVAARGSGAAA
jgi:hypothetical protein